MSELPPITMLTLSHYDWRGNIRLTKTFDIPGHLSEKAAFLSWVRDSAIKFYDEANKK